MGAGRHADLLACRPLADRQPNLARLEGVRRYVFFIGLAGIVENAYFHHFKQLNATHCRRVFEFFRGDRAEVSLIRRRREGH